MKLFSEETLFHYGIPGQKKGVRRWQYQDGRFNEEGKERYFGKKSEFKGLTQEQRNLYNQELYDDQLEKRYKQMIYEKEHPKMSKVKKTISSLAKNTIVDSLILSASLYAGSKILGKFFQYGFSKDPIKTLDTAAKVHAAQDILKNIFNNSKSLRDWANIIPKK